MLQCLTSHCIPPTTQISPLSTNLNNLPTNSHQQSDNIASSTPILIFLLSSEVRLRHLQSPKPLSFATEFEIIIFTI